MLRKLVKNRKFWLTSYIISYAIIAISLLGTIACIIGYFLRKVAFITEAGYVSKIDRFLNKDINNSKRDVIQYEEHWLRVILFFFNIFMSLFKNRSILLT